MSITNTTTIRTSSSQSDFSGMTGFVLHRRPYRETSLLVDFFTAQWGKVSAVAKGVTSAKSPRKSLLQPFQALNFDLAGRSSLKNLRQLEPTGLALNLKGTQSYCGLYVNELLNRVLAPEQSQPELYQYYYACLTALSQSENSQGQNDRIEPILREFEAFLLNTLGYGIDYSQDWQTGEALDEGAYYCFVNQHGLQRLKGKIADRNCFAGAQLGKLAQQHWDRESLTCAKVIHRIALQDLIGNKPLKSRELFVQQKRPVNSYKK